MEKYTQKEMRALAARPGVHDITYGTYEDRKEILEREGHLVQFAYAAGTDGCAGQAFYGHNTGDIYVIAGRTTALYIFG